MKIGDRVMVNVGPCKDRGAVVENIIGKSVEVKFDMGPTAYVSVGDLSHYNDEIIPAKPTEATKHDSNKNRLELIPVSGIEGIGRAMTFGATKYNDNNWANGFNYTRLYGSAMRHLTSWMQGQDKDPESGLSHLDHLGACVVMLIAHETEGLGNDDRRKTVS